MNLVERKKSMRYVSKGVMCKNWSIIESFIVMINMCTAWNIICTLEYTYISKQLNIRLENKQAYMNKKKFGGKCRYICQSLLNKINLNYKTKIKEEEKNWTTNISNF